MDLEKPELRTFFKYIKDKPNLFVAGGYPVLQFIDRDLGEYPSSDIDVFVLNKDDTGKESAKEFDELNVEEQKRFLIETLDKNALYVNLSEMDDKSYGVSEEDKRLNRQFYGL